MTSGMAQELPLLVSQLHFRDVSLYFHTFLHLSKWQFHPFGCTGQKPWSHPALCSFTYTSNQSGYSIGSTFEIYQTLCEAKLSFSIAQEGQKQDRINRYGETTFLFVCLLIKRKSHSDLESGDINSRLALPHHSFVALAGYNSPLSLFASHHSS